jgi:hypothetical protein
MRLFPPAYMVRPGTTHEFFRSDRPYTLMRFRRITPQSSSVLIIR